MPVYRGPGGAGDATNDATVTAVQSAATSAATSATAAANSATAAANSATGAAASATNAANSATTAAGQATTAAGHATNASTFATNSSLSATDSADSATEAEGYASEAFDYKVEASVSAGSASDSADAAAASADLAEGAVDDALALYGDAAALDAAVTAAQLAETNAETAETNAETAATTATNAASTATTQATNAAASALAADADATAASIDANEAQAAATAAQAAVNSATAIYGSIEDIQQAEVNSEANRDAAAASADLASNSASTATTQAGIATTQATNAATSAAQASAVALGNEPVRHSVRPSLLLDFANTKTLDPRITYTRASAGTYYDGKTVAKAEENLLIRSEEFDNAAWTKAGCTITANSTTAPNGTTTADTLVESSGGTFHWIDYANSSLVPSGTTVTVSVYLKPNGRTWANINLGTGQGAYFDVANGVVGTTAGTLLSTSITAVGNGWYRCVISASTATATGRLQVYAATANGTVSYSGDGTSGLFVWGAQLEQRSTVTAYTATTTAPITNYVPVLLSAPANVARFEHNPVTGESLGLEIEEQRTNLLLYSEQFNDAYWTKTNATITPNTAIAPDGIQTADKIYSNSSVFGYVSKSISGVTAIAYSVSVYAKAGEMTFLEFNLQPPEGGNATTWFNLSTGAVGTNSSGSTSSITSVGNGWYRCVITRTLGASGSLGMQISATNGNGSETTGNGFSGIYIWGAQLEAGAFATSYIPTTVSQVTRSADSASMTGTNFSSWYNTSQGTVYYQYDTVSLTTSRTVGELSDGTSNNRYLWQSNPGGSARNLTFINGSAVVALDTTAALSAKWASAYSIGSYASSYNGNTALTSSYAGVAPNINQLILGHTIGGGAQQLNGTIKKLAYYPKRLTNAEITSLTVI